MRRRGPCTGGPAQRGPVQGEVLRHNSSCDFGVGSILHDRHRTKRSSDRGGAGYFRECGLCSCESASGFLFHVSTVCVSGRSRRSGAVGFMRGRKQRLSEQCSRAVLWSFGYVPATAALRQVSERNGSGAAGIAKPSSHGALWVIPMPAWVETFANKPSVFFFDRRVERKSRRLPA
jgi:hypothetical protein